MSSAAARSGTAKGFVGARWWGKPRGEPNVGEGRLHARSLNGLSRGFRHRARCARHETLAVAIPN